MQALGELEEIRFVVHGQKGFNPDRKRVFAILSKSGLPMGVDIVFSSPGSKDQNLRRDESAAALGCAVVPRDSDSPAGSAALRNFVTVRAPRVLVWAQRGVSWKRRADGVCCRCVANDEDADD